MLDTEGKISLTLDFCRKRLLVLGFTGSGKSYALGVLLEEVEPLDIPFIVLDYANAHLGLRTLKNTRIFKPRGNKPKELGELIAKTNYNVIIPRGNLLENEYFYFCNAFLVSYMKRRQKATRILVVDEAHRFCPLHGGHKIKGTLENIATSGRAEGLILWTASQRHALLSKTISNESDNKLIFRLLGHTDLKRIEDFLKPHYEDTKSTKVAIKEILNYKAGECLLIDVDDSLDVKGGEVNADL